MRDASAKNTVDSPPVVILAGGRGARLLPYTTSFPKPLMPLGDRPILEIVLRQLARDGLTDITLAVGHLSSLIEAYFGDGAACGVRLTYLREEIPLGTAGPLTRLPVMPDHLLVLNGDILTDLDFSAFLSHHRRGDAAATIVTVAQKIPVQYGVLTTDARGLVESYEEKPELKIEVSGGVYAFSRRVLSFIPHNRRFDFPDLVWALLDQNEKIAAFRHDGYWLDIGCRDDYEKATELFEKRPDLFRLAGPAVTKRIAAGVGATIAG